MAGEYWSQITNPATGRPYASQQEYTSSMLSNQAATIGKDMAAAGANASAQGFNKEHTTTYDFGQSGLWNTNAGGYNFFGTAGGGDQKVWVNAKDPGGPRLATREELQNFIANKQADWSNSQGFYQVAANGGYINPNTGQITYATSGSAYGPSAQTQTKSYYYDQDYGLGPSAKGIIPLQRDANGTPTAFYAGTAGGGGQVFSSLADAQASVAAYKQWYDTQHPAGTSGTQIAPTVPGATAPAAAPTSSAPGILTTPGAGETYYGGTKDFYSQPTNAQKQFDSTKDFYGQPTNAQQVFNETPNQPTEQQQLWNAYSGMYKNPNYLDDYYDTEERKAQTTLDRKSASAGWGDSSASARATGGIGLDFAGRKLLARQGFTTTGMGLAGAADSSGLALTGLRGQLASGADTGNLGRVTAGQAAAGAADSADLARTTAGQSAANSAQGLQISRETGGLASATQLANDQAALVTAGLSAATSASYANQLAVLQGQWQQAGLTAQQQYQKAQELAASMGIIANSAFNYYLSTRFGGGTPSNPYSPGAGASSGTLFNV